MAGNEVLASEASRAELEDWVREELDDWGPTQRRDRVFKLPWPIVRLGVWPRDALRGACQNCSRPFERAPSEEEWVCFACYDMVRWFERFETEKERIKRKGLTANGIRIQQLKRMGASVRRKRQRDRLRDRLRDRDDKVQRNALLYVYRKKGFTYKRLAEKFGTSPSGASQIYKSVEKRIKSRQKDWKRRVRTGPYLPRDPDEGRWLEWDAEQNYRETETLP